MHAFACISGVLIFWFGVTFTFVTVLLLRPVATTDYSGCPIGEGVAILAVGLSCFVIPIAISFGGLWLTHWGWYG
jgi:hypothetical protein